MVLNPTDVDPPDVDVFLFFKNKYKYAIPDNKMMDPITILVIQLILKRFLKMP